MKCLESSAWLQKMVAGFGFLLSQEEMLSLIVLILVWELGIHQPSFLQSESQVDSCSHWSKGCGLLSLRACLYSVFCAVCVPCMSVFCVPVLCVQSPEASVSRSSSSESELSAWLLFCFLEPWAHLSDKNLENKRRNYFLILIGIN